MHSPTLRRTGTLCTGNTCVLDLYVAERARHIIKFEELRQAKRAKRATNGSSLAQLTVAAGEAETDEGAAEGKAVPPEKEEAREDREEDLAQ